MVVVVAPPSSAKASPPLFVFATEKGWRASLEWKEAVALRGEDAVVVFVDVPSEAGSVPLEQAAAAVKGASVVVLGGTGKNLGLWTDFGLDEALVSCHKAGGIITAVGQICRLLAGWYHDGGTRVCEGVGLIPESVIEVVKAESEWDVVEKVVAALHGEGHDRVKAYGIGNSVLGGAIFYQDDVLGQKTGRAEALGEDIMEASSVPKTASIGKSLKIRKVRVGDQAILKVLGVDPETRWNKALSVVAKWLVAANGTVVVSTGAGVSAESGIPTYRDEGGLWEIYDQMEVSHIKGFARDPMKCWRFELELYQVLKHCGPNPAHKGLQQLEEIGVVKTVITQNVDGLHLAAGSKDVIELHGSETRGICMKKACRKTVPYLDVFKDLGWVCTDGSTSSSAPALPSKKKQRAKGGIYAELTDSSASSSNSSSSSDEKPSSEEAPSSPSDCKKKECGPSKFEIIIEKIRVKTKDPEASARIANGPICPHCKEGILKPDAVYFGEGLPQAQIKRAVALSKAAKGFLIVGTSGQVAPACKLPEMAKAVGGARVVEVSLRETDLSAKSDMLLLGSAATVLPALVEAVEREIAEKTASGVISTEKESDKAEEAEQDDEVDKPIQNGRAKRPLVIKKAAAQKKPAANVIEKKPSGNGK